MFLTAASTLFFQQSLIRKLGVHNALDLLIAARLIMAKKSWLSTALALPFFEATIVVDGVTDLEVADGSIWVRSERVDINVPGFGG